MTKTYQEINFSESFTFVWPISLNKSLEAAPVYTVCDFNDFKASTTGLKVIFPSVSNSTLSVGKDFIFNNIGLNPFTIQTTNEDGTLTDLITIQSGENYYFFLKDTSTSNGVWRIVPWGGGASAITSINITKSSDSPLEIQNGSIVAPGGNVNLDLNSKIKSLNQFNTDGLIGFKTGATPAFFVTKLVSDPLGNIKISNPTGVDGSPTVDVIPNPSFGSVSLSGMKLSGNKIDASNTTSGDGTILIDGLSGVMINSTLLVKKSVQTPSVSVAGTLEVGKDLIVYSMIKNPFVSQAWVNFTDDGTTVKVSSDANITSVTRSGPGIYNVNFRDPMINANYAVYEGYVSGGFVEKVKIMAKTTSSVTIHTVGSNNSLVTPDKDVSIVVFSAIEDI